ncbi:HAD family hydrolase [Alienimonas californiensis]|uniref:Phosphoglycolate phosphatase n=1 Tax=Alienimonas californiensis TaxID=2527989 RepID=A0A517PAX1_9PLAN|nr:HAD family hydrolase [Alienimonas californiensis]QDT16517.1 Phosphoglycolate phosphatase [Alienimonas californiensis]
MDEVLQAVIRAHARPMEPRPTGTAPVLTALPGVRAVLFDVYGTLLISGSGDVGVNAAAGRGDAFVAAVRAAGLAWPDDRDGAEGVAGLTEEIERQHAHARKHDGVQYPEVKIHEVWRNALVRLGVTDTPHQTMETLDRVALEYEMRVNPTWTMPHAAETLESLRSRGFLLGIVSNAQSFTPLLFPALLGKTIRDFGFDRNAMGWSYLHRQAKPGTALYEHAARALQRDHGIGPEQVLYVGNDLLNDCTPAQQVGFRTALFAGDARSLRWREGDERVAETRPTVVVTDLRQLLECVSGAA